MPEAKPQQQAAPPAKDHAQVQADQRAREQAEQAKSEQAFVQAQTDDPRTPASPAQATATLGASGDEPRRGRGRRVRALSNMSHTNPLGEVEYTAKTGELVDEDSPLVAMHPTMFERFE